MPCPFREKIGAFQSNLLEDDEATAVAKHLLLENCEECEAEADQQVDVTLAIDAWARQQREQRNQAQPE
jgi:hypothetical protein